jgi:hypothetical protein
MTANGGGGRGAFDFDRMTVGRTTFLSLAFLLGAVFKTVR